jgi:hypothetical protein
MSHAYEARFAGVDQDLSAIIAGLEPCLEKVGLVFDGEVTQLQSQGGLAVVASMESKRVTQLTDIPRLANRWWGVSLFCISTPLADALGRTDAIEVYLRIVKVAEARRVIVYNEASAAFHARAELESLSQQLTSTLVAICSAVGSELAIYMEEDPELSEPSLDELRQRLVRQGQASEALAFHAVVKSEVLSLADARELVGPWAEHLRLSTNGYVVLPFLSNQT